MTRKKITLEDILSHPAAAPTIRPVSHYHMMACPFHDDHSPSLLVFEDGFNCRAASCEQRGSLRRLWEKLECTVPAKRPLVQTFIRWSDILDRDDHPKPEFIRDAHDATIYPDVRSWYERRGLEEMIERCTLGWWRGWYVTPVFDEHGQPLRVILRAGDGLDVESKYIVSPGDPVLYVPDWGLLHTRPEFAVFPFGCYDAISVAMLRFPAITGAGPCLDLPLKLFDGLRRKLYVVPDAEPESERNAARRYVTEFGWRGRLVRLNYPLYTKDPNDYLRTGRDRDLAGELGRWCSV